MLRLTPKNVDNHLIDLIPQSEWTFWSKYSLNYSSFDHPHSHCILGRPGSSLVLISSKVASICYSTLFIYDQYIPISFLQRFQFPRLNDDFLPLKRKWLLTNAVSSSKKHCMSPYWKISGEYRIKDWSQYAALKDSCIDGLNLRQFLLLLDYNHSIF